jgi:hypothetical protein
MSTLVDLAEDDDDSYQSSEGSQEGSGSGSGSGSDSSSEGSEEILEQGGLPQRFSSQHDQRSSSAESSGLNSAALSRQGNAPVISSFFTPTTAASV